MAPMMGKNVIKRAISVLRRFGSNAHAYIPGGSALVQAGNLLLQSNTFSNVTSWATRTSITLLNANAVSDPFGGTSASTLQFDVAGSGVLQQVVSGTSGISYNGSIWVRRRIGTGVIHLRVAELSGFAIPITSEWVRVSVPNTSTTTTIRFGIFGYGASIGDQIDIYGAQLETGSTANPYVPTTTSASQEIRIGNTITGLQSGNYKTTAGTECAQVDDSGGAGLALDALGTLGSELVVNGTFGSGVTTGWMPAGSYASTLSVVSGSLRVTKTQAIGAAYVEVATVVGKTYMVSGTAIGKSGAGNIDFRVGTTPESTVYLRNNTMVAGQIFTGYFVATATLCCITLISVGGASGDYNDWDNISVREVPGIHATQGTGGLKPYVRRGIVNLLTYSQDFSNSAWTKTDTTPTTGQTDPLGGTSGTLLTQGAAGTSVVLLAAGIGTIANTAYTASVYVKGTSGFLRFQLVDNGTQAIGVQCWVNLSTGVLASFATKGAATSVDAIASPAGNGFTRISVTQAQASTILTLVMQIVTADGGTTRVSGGTYTVYGSQLELGSTASTYIPTTSAAASSPTGPQYWAFDGSNDYLSLDTPAWGASDDSWVVAAALINNGTTTGNRGIASPCNDDTVASKRMGALAFNAPAGKLAASWYDGTLYNYTEITQATGTAFVAATVRRGSTGYLRVNGGAQSSSVSITASVAPVNGRIGSLKPTDVSTNFPGNIYCVFAGKGTITDADLLLLEKLAGTIAGVTI